MQNHVFTIAKVCQQFGAEYAVICPGSRSAPLVFAFTQTDGIRCISAIDERSAAFVALGMAQQRQKPVVLICTSGTAGLNFYPAIAEAYYQKIPLLILTADRPPELLNQQDGQMIKQKGVFDKHVLASHELLCYDEDKVDDKLTERIVLTALNECMSEHGYGPVHINVPLREPLYNMSELPEIPAITINIENPHVRGITPPPLMQLLATAWKQSKRKMILVGQTPPSGKVSAMLNSLINQDDVVVLADVVSNQHEQCTAPLFDSLLQFGSNRDISELKPDLILSFGGAFVSKSLKIWLKQQKPAYHFRINQGETLIDTYQNVTHPIQANIHSYLDAFQSMRIFHSPTHKPYADNWKAANKEVAKKLEDFYLRDIWCEPRAMKQVLQYLPENSHLQLGNSSSVRWVSWEGIPLKALHVFGNRGTSGIDSSVSTAIGSARMMAHKTVTLICGDLSLFYDQNAFWQPNLPANLKLVILNNEAGNIFNWIDGPSSHPNQLDYFVTNHRLSIHTLAKQYDLKHILCENLSSLQECLKQLYEPSDKPVILELKFENSSNLSENQNFRSIQW